MPTQGDVEVVVIRQGEQLQEHLRVNGVNREAARFTKPRVGDHVVSDRHSVRLRLPNCNKCAQLQN